MTTIDFLKKRRQIYLDEESYRNTIAQIDAEYRLYLDALEGNLTARGRRTTLELLAGDKRRIFQLKFTAGESLTELANSLDDAVVAAERWVDACNDMPDEEYSPPFVMNDMIDTYVDYLNLLCAAILLRREDLIPRIHALNEDTDFDGVDAVLEELLKFFLPDRPELDEWIWDKPYRKLLDAIDSDTPAEMATAMRVYVRSWYKDMKGTAHFWGKHEHIVPEYTAYLGYWAMCAAAFTYLYDIDDTSYRDEAVYPQDLVDYARSIPRQDLQQKATTPPLRVAGNETCPKSGQWFTPSKGNSHAHFKAGDLMPDFPDAEYGLTIWQWMGS